MSKHEKKQITKGERAWRVSVTVLGAVFLWCIITYFVTPLFMRYPNRDIEAEKLLDTYGNVREVLIPGSHELSGYLFDDPSSEKLLVYFYGISDNAASCMLDFLGSSAFKNMDIAVIDWPSYGKSKGFCSDNSMRDTASATVNAFREGAIQDYSCSDIIIMGYSLGTGPAVYAAAECGCSVLILISPYYCAADLYNQITPIFYGPLKGLLGFRMDSFNYASEVSVTPLIIASANDRRVPLESSERLAAVFPSGCDTLILQSAEHGALPYDPEVLQALDTRLLP